MWFDKKTSKWHIFHTGVCIEGGQSDVKIDMQPVTSQFSAKPLSDEQLQQNVSQTIIHQDVQNLIIVFFCKRGLAIISCLSLLLTISFMTLPMQKSLLLSLVVGQLLLVLQPYSATGTILVLDLRQM